MSGSVHYSDVEGRTQFCVTTPANEEQEHICALSRWYRVYRHGVRSRATRILLTVGSALLVSLPQAALAQTSTVCGPEVKEEVVKALAGLR